MAWTVGFLPKADQDLQGLTNDANRRAAIAEAIVDEFVGRKGGRVTKLFVQGVTTSSIDRLDGSAFPGSIRLQVFADHRATALCLPQFKQAFVTHVFHKSQDPNYRRAVPTHDARAREYVSTFVKFLNARGQG